MYQRELARRIVRMRRLLNLGIIAELKDATELAARREAEFAAIMRTLPIGVQMEVEKYVVDPARRKVDREGLLAQNDGGA